MASPLHGVRVLLLCVLPSLAASSVRADSVGVASEATRLFDEAQAAMAADDYTSACAKLEASQHIDPQLGTQLHLAHCYEKRGSIATAYRAFLAAARVAAERNASGVVEPRETVARRRAASLEPRLSTLRLEVNAPTADLRIELDGEPLERAQWEAPLPIDPGQHTLLASAATRQPWRHELTVGDAASKLVVQVPALVLARNERPVVATAGLVPVEVAAPPVGTAAELPTGAPSLQRTLGYVVLGVGAVGLGLGVAFGVVRNGKVSALEQDCDLDGGTCRIAAGDDAARRRIGSLDRDAHRFATAATLGLVLGGAAAAAGLVLVLTAPDDEARDVALGIGPNGIHLTAHADVL